MLTSDMDLFTRQNSLEYGTSSSLHAMANAPTELDTQARLAHHFESANLASLCKALCSRLVGLHTLLHLSNTRNIERVECVKQTDSQKRKQLQKIVLTI